MKLKKLRKTSFLNLCLIALLLFSSNLIFTIIQTSDNFKILNNENTRYSYDITFKGTLDNPTIIKYLDCLKKNDNMIIKYTILEGFNKIGETMGIYFNDKYDINYNLLEGRFFTPSDFNSNKNTVVIGKKLVDKAFTEDGKKYLTNGAKKHEVIGVIGYEDYNTPLDTMVIYNLDSILNDTNLLRPNSWIVSSNSDNTYLENYFNGSSIEYHKPQNLIANPMKMSIDKNSNLLTMSSFIILGIFITFFTCLTHWVNSLKQEIGIRKSFGASESSIYKDIFTRYILLTFISTTLTLFIQFFASKIGFLPYKINILSLLFCDIFLILFGLIFLFILIYKLKSAKLQYLLKE
ncbi:MAG: ABC transporter permease [Clostridium sp.]